MSEFHVTVVRLPEPVPVPNSDSLDLFVVNGGYPVISKRGNYKGGDLAAYVPVDAIVPANDPRFDFLGKHLRVRAMRLRGTFSMGLLTPAEPGWVEGQNVQEELRITKFEPPEERDEANEKDPGWLPVYDVEGLRRWPGVIAEGEAVSITEKTHGENARVAHDGERLWVGSRTKMKKDLPGSKWWQAAKAAGLEEKCKDLSARFQQTVIVYGESHGYTTGFPYGVKPGGAWFRAFDAYLVREGRWLDVAEFFPAMAAHGIPTVPILFQGPWSESLRSLAEGKSTMDERHVREGFVVRTAKERTHEKAGRVNFKLVGEGFLLEK